MERGFSSLLAQVAQLDTQGLFAGAVDTIFKQAGERSGGARSLEGEAI